MSDRCLIHVDPNVFAIWDICVGNPRHHWLISWIFACSLPSPFKQYWIIINQTLGNMFQLNFNQTTTIHIYKNELEIIICKIFCPSRNALITHWGRVTHIGVGKLTSTGSDNDFICNDAGILLIGTLGTNLTEILCDTNIFSFKKINLEMTCAKWWQLYLGLDVSFMYLLVN